MKKKKEYVQNEDEDKVYDGDKDKDNDEILNEKSFE